MMSRSLALALILLTGLLSSAVAQDDEVVLWQQDLSAGNAGTGDVKGGSFVPLGWTPVGQSDSIRWNLRQVPKVDAGHLTVEMTNLNPPKQALYPKNQFLSINACGESGAQIRLRMGTNYKQFKVEAKQDGVDRWDEVPVNPLKVPFDETLVYKLRFQWGPTKLRLSINGTQFYSQPWTVRGVCSLQIGESFTNGAFPGPIYTSIKYAHFPNGDPDCQGAPATPGRFVGYAGNRSVELNWAVPDCTTGYVVSRNGVDIASNLIRSTFVDTGLENGETYCYTVRALNGQHSSAPSAQVCRVPFAPPEPTIPLEGCKLATPNSKWVNTSFAEQTGQFTVEFDARANVSNIGANVALSLGKPSIGYEGFAALVALNSNGTITARNGGAYRAASRITYTAFKVYHFRLVVDVPSHTYTAYVTPEGGEETLIGENYAFRSEQATITSLKNWGVFVNSSRGLLQVCNFKITDSTPFVPPPLPPITPPSPEPEQETEQETE
jgi:hypothetical protein